MSRIIELPDDVYESLERVAREQGFTPVGWIANAVPPLSTERLLADLLEGLIGTVNSAEVPAGQRRHAPFSEGLTRKFQKQGSAEYDHAASLRSAAINRFRIRIP